MISSHEGDLSGIKGLTKRAMNWMSGNRTISIQEAVHEIEELPLILCSERIMPVYINKFMSLRREKQENPDDCLSRYANRKGDMDMSLHRYFYQRYVPYRDERDLDKEDYRQPIMNGIGMNCKAVHPISFEYARGLLILHRPWSKASYLDFRDKQKIIDTGTKMLEEKLVPYNVYSEYYRAKNKKTQLDLVAKKTHDDFDEQPKEQEDSDYIDQDIQARNARHFTNGTIHGCDIAGEKVDLGFNHDWSVSSFKGSRDTKVDGEAYIDWAKSEMENIDW